jgi:hypothetical protein
MELMHQLTPMLRTLRLSGILETLDVRNRQAVEQQSSFVDFLTGNSRRQCATFSLQFSDKMRLLLRMPGQFSGNVLR